MREKFDVTLRATRFGETQDPSSNPARNEVLPARVLIDLNIDYNLTEQLKLTVGANNLFDVYPRPTRENVVDLTLFSRIFPYSSFSPFGFNGRYLYGKIDYSF